MIDQNTVMVWGVIIATLTFVGTTIKDMWRGGSKFHSRFTDINTKFTDMETNNIARFNALEQRQAADAANIRLEIATKINGIENLHKLGLDAITASIHALQLASVEFRAKMAEEYIRKENFYKATDELKRDVKEDLSEVKASLRDMVNQINGRFENMEMIIEANRSASARSRQQNERKAND